MNGIDWLEITILLQGKITSIFSFVGTTPEPPSGDRWPLDPHEGDKSPPRTPRVEGCTNFLGYTSDWNKDL